MADNEKKKQREMEVRDKIKYLKERLQAIKSQTDKMEKIYLHK